MISSRSYINYSRTVRSVVDTYLHHEQQCVENDEGHDEILEGRRDDYSPHFVLKTRPFAWHIPLKRSRFYREVYTRFL